MTLLKLVFGPTLLLEQHETLPNLQIDGLFGSFEKLKQLENATKPRKNSFWKVDYPPEI